MGKILKARSLILLATIVTFFSCATSEKNSSKIKILNVGVQWVGTTLDPHQAIGLPEALWQSYVFEPLFSYDENLRPVPVLVKEINYFKKTGIITIKLKRNRRFSNGAPLTSEDVIESFKRSLKLYPFSSYLTEIKGAVEFKSGKTYEIRGLVSIGKYSLEVHLKKILPEPSHVFSALNTAIVKKGRNRNFLYGTGPYRIYEIKRTSRETIITLKPNLYFSPAPRINTINFHLLHSSTAFSSYVKKCKLDIFVSYIPYGQETPPCYTIIRSPLMGGLYMIINPWLSPTNDRNLRYLLRYIAWKNNFVETIKFPMGVHPKLIAPYGMMYFSYLKNTGLGKIPVVKQNVSLRTRNFREKTRLLFLEYLAKKLSGYGIKLKNLGWVKDWGKFTLTGGKEGLNFFLVYYVPSSPSPYHFFYSVFSLKGELNAYNYPYPDGLKLLEKYVLTENGRERVKLLNEMEKIAERENISFPVMYTLFMVGKRKDLHGVLTNNLGLVFLNSLRKLK